MSVSRPESVTVWAGPILRRLTPGRLVIWLVVDTPCTLDLTLYPSGQPKRNYHLKDTGTGLRLLTLSPRCHYLMLDLCLETPLPEDTWIQYQLAFLPEGPRARATLTQLLPDLCYPGQDLPGFRLTTDVEALLHGSCRKPHFAGGDGLVEADRYLQRCFADASTGTWPSLLLMSGDQIYADDVAGPMLSALHQWNQLVKVANESFSDLASGDIVDATSLYKDPDSFYRRERLLPASEANQSMMSTLIGGARKPVFTSDHAHNHLISLGEFLAVYLLSWSPEPWRHLSTDAPRHLDSDQLRQFQDQQAVMNEFVAGLPQARRVMAHLPTAMVFDDHDISDDWNLNRAWEEEVYGHPFSKRMIGNGLLAYLINQAWGNDPDRFEAGLLQRVQDALARPGGREHDALIEHLLFDFEQWDYTWETQPPLVVLDTRTRRWRSESSPHKSSGLVDWEALTDLQRELRGRDAVLLVSAAPIFGVKLIEVIQRVVSFLGKPLAVDAENWMAHPGTANGILNVFRHRKTPHHFIVLSGDVHYSFVYDVEIRGKRNSPKIWQISSSGLRNEFPARLLAVLDHLNRWLYSPRSPLNWFTRRRIMQITPRKPVGMPSGRRLLNASGIGLVELDNTGQPIRIRQLVAGGEVLEFERRDEESNWH